MLRKVRNLFFLEEAKASTSDKAVIILMALAMGLAIYAAAVVYASTF